LSRFNIYEDDEIRDLMGENLRPGGLKLTKDAVEFCQLKPKAKLLDIGCGIGNSIAYLEKNYDVDVIGIDPSEKLLNIARNNHPKLEFIKASAENLPFKSEEFHMVLTECSLSLVEDIKKGLKEITRVLKEDGYLIINDVYAKENTYLKELKKIPINTCMRSLHDIDELRFILENYGFNIVLFKDYSQYLKELMVKIIFKYGSMSVFWSENINNCMDINEFQEMFKKSKPGYFTMIAKRGKGNNGRNIL